MIIDGKKLSQDIIAKLKEERKSFTFNIRLAVILVGDNSAALSFIKQKEKIAKELDVDFRLYQYPVSIKTKALRAQVNHISRLPTTKGVVVQLPLPKSIQTQTVLNGIIGRKDPDVLSENNLGKFYTQRLPILPPVVAAIRFLVETYKIPLVGKNVLIIGRGPLVGKPLALWFIHQGATVTVANSHTQNLIDYTQKAEIIVSSAGQPHLITSEMVSSKVIIFDAATVSENNKLQGDCDLEGLKDKVSLITPVPGGLGPLTVAFLFQNLFTLLKLKSF